MMTTACLTQSDVPSQPPVPARENPRRRSQLFVAVAITVAIVLVALMWIGLRIAASQIRELGDLLPEANVHQWLATSFILRTDQFVAERPALSFSCILTWCGLLVMFANRPAAPKFLRRWCAVTLSMLGSLLLICSLAVSQPTSQILAQLAATDTNESPVRYAEMLEDSTTSNRAQQKAADALSKLALRSRIGLVPEVDSELKPRLITVAQNDQLTVRQRFEAARVLLSIDVLTGDEQQIVSKAIRMAVTDTDPELRRSAEVFLQHRVMNVSSRMRFEGQE